MKNTCKQCGKPTINRYFCSRGCHSRYSGKLDHLPAVVDAVIRIVYKSNGNRFPHGSLTVIGAETGYSRERIRQKVHKMGLPRVLKYTESLPKKECQYCGKIFAPKHPNNNFCSDECARLLHFYTYNLLKICKTCGLGFITSTSRSNARAGGRNREYCSKVCWGVHAGKTYGWGNKQTIRTRYPQSGQVLIKVLGGDTFTAEKFRETFGYSKRGIAKVLKKMQDDKLIEYDLLGNYRVIAK